MSYFNRLDEIEKAQVIGKVSENQVAFKAEKTSFMEYKRLKEKFAKEMVEKKLAYMENISYNFVGSTIQGSTLFSPSQKIVLSHSGNGHNVVASNKRESEEKSVSCNITGSTIADSKLFSPSQKDVFSHTGNGDNVAALKKRRLSPTQLRDVSSDFKRPAILKKCVQIMSPMSSPNEAALLKVPDMGTARVIGLELLDESKSYKNIAMRLQADNKHKKAKLQQEKSTTNHLRSERDVFGNSINRLRGERDEARSERDEARSERDEARMQRDHALKQLNEQMTDEEYEYYVLWRLGFRFD